MIALNVLLAVKVTANTITEVQGARSVARPTLHGTLAGSERTLPGELNERIAVPRIGPSS